MYQRVSLSTTNPEGRVTNYEIGSIGDLLRAYRAIEKFELSRLSTNDVDAFFARCVVVTGSDKDRVSGGELLSAFNKWRGSWPTDGRGRTILYRKIRLTRWVTITNAGNRRSYHGVKLNVAQTPDEEYDDLI